MGDVARCSVQNEEILYKLFGVNAELLIDHAWGWEPCTIAQIKAYRPADNSIGEGQVLHCAYTAAKGKLIMKEMMDKLILKLVDKGLVTDHIVLTVGYDMESLEIPEIRENYRGEITKDWYGRLVPKHAHGSVTLERPTSSARIIMEEAEKLYDRIVDPILLVRRLTVAAARVLPEQEAAGKEEIYEQMDLFMDYEALEKEREIRNAIREVGIQYLADTYNKIVVEFTPHGENMYRSMLHLRPQYTKKSGNIYEFCCSERQADNYFFKFGHNARILEPERLADAFRRKYENAAKKYM